MSRIRSYGPSLVLALLIAAVLLGGPQVARQIAHAQQEVDIRQVRQDLRESPLGDLSSAFRDVAQVVEPSVVHISVSREAPQQQRRGMPDDLPEGFPETPEDLRRWFFERRPDRDGRQPPQEEQQQQAPPEDYYQAPIPFGNGSGWIYSDGRHIITNNHVVQEADEIEVKFHDRTTAKAEIVGRDEQTDIAVLRLADEKELHPSDISSNPVDRGDIVFAFGSPFGFEFSMSQGIVSGKGRQIGILGQMGYENFIQTDAAINQGNSGGPLTNFHGEVIGMNTAIATQTGGNMGIGFAIPAEMIVGIVDQLIAEGRVTRGYLGVWIQDLNPELARSFGYDSQEGVLVEDVVGDDSPAGEGGIEGGDIITAIEDQPVRNASELRRRVAMLAPDETIAVTVFRDGEERTFDVTLSEQPGEVGAAQPSRQAPEAEPEAEDLGALRELGIEDVSTLTEEQAEQLDVDFQPGVLIEQVRRGSVAFAAGLRPGVIILEVMNSSVENVDELSEEMAKHDLSEGVRLRILINGVRRFVLLTLPDEEE